MAGHEGGSKSAVVLVVVAVAIALVVNMFAGNHTKKSETKYYDDPLNVLSQETKDYLQDINKTLEKDYGGAQLFVAVVETTGNKSVSQYAKAYFYDKGIGSSQHNNGLLLLVAKNEGTYHTMYGTGLDDTFAGELAVVLKKYMEPEFAKGNMTEAIETVTPKLAGVLKTECSIWYSGKAKTVTEAPEPTLTEVPVYDADEIDIDEIVDRVTSFDAVSFVGSGIGFLIKLAFKILAGLFSSVVIGIIVVIIIIRSIIKSGVNKRDGRR